MSGSPNPMTLESLAQQNATLRGEISSLRAETRAALDRLRLDVMARLDGLLAQLAQRIEGGAAAPPMTPERAREISVGYQALAQHFRGLGVETEARNADRQGERWAARARGEQ